MNCWINTNAGFYLKIRAMREKIIKNCLECGEVIVGRIDKKFCSDLCRNSHNNDRLIHINKKLSNTNSILKKNRQILERLIEQRIRKISRENLLRQGFNFYYITGMEYDSVKCFCFYCYEYGYYVLEGNYYKFLKRPDK